MGIIAATGCPESYEDLWIHYRRYVIRQVISMGIPPGDAEDVASEVMTTFIDRDMLASFDGERLHDVTTQPGRPRHMLIDGPRMRPARFTSYLRRFVYLYTLSHRQKIMTRMGRESLTLDAPMGDGEESWAAALADPDWEAPLTAATMGEDARAVILRALPKIRATEGRAGPDGEPRWTLADAFEACARSVEELGVVNRRHVAESLGVSTTAVAAILARLREALTEAGAAELLRSAG